MSLLKLVRFVNTILEVCCTSFQEKADAFNRVSDKRTAAATSEKLVQASAWTKPNTSVRWAQLPCGAEHGIGLPAVNCLSFSVDFAYGAADIGWTISEKLVQASAWTKPNTSVRWAQLPCGAEHGIGLPAVNCLSFSVDFAYGAADIGWTRRGVVLDKSLEQAGQIYFCNPCRLRPSGRWCRFRSKRTLEPVPGSLFAEHDTPVNCKLPLCQLTPPTSRVPTQRGVDQ